MNNSMEKNHNGQETDEQQTGAGKNPTLDEKGASVADYGNVMGGSSDANVPEQGSGGEGRSGESNDTTGNP
jgi:hypothetical protein